jgi:hypothetical protein
LHIHRRWCWIRDIVSSMIMGISGVFVMMGFGIRMYVVPLSLLLEQMEMLVEGEYDCG